MTKTIKLHIHMSFSHELGNQASHAFWSIKICLCRLIDTVKNSAKYHAVFNDIDKTHYL